MEWPIGNTFYICNCIHIVVINNLPIIYYPTLYTVGQFLFAVAVSYGIGTVAGSYCIWPILSRCCWSYGIIGTVVADLYGIGTVVAGIWYFVLYYPILYYQIYYCNIYSWSCFLVLWFSMMHSWFRCCWFMWRWFWCWFSLWDWLCCWLYSTCFAVAVAVAAAEQQYLIIYGSCWVAARTCLFEFI